MLVHLLSLLLLSFAVSIDGFGVGVTYGLRNIRIPIVSVFIIACCSGFVIWLSMGAGAWLSHYLSPGFSKVLGAIILIGIGGWALLQYWQNRKRDQNQAADHSSNGVYTENLIESPFGSVSVSVSTVWKIELKRLGLVIQILRTPQSADVDHSGVISASEALLLGSALSLDAFGAGLGAAMIGFSPLLTALLIAVASGIFLLSGMRIGLRFSAWRGMRAFSILPGLILILMGITRLL